MAYRLERAILWTGLVLLSPLLAAWGIYAVVDAAREYVEERIALREEQQ